MQIFLAIKLDASFPNSKEYSDPAARKLPDGRVVFHSAVFELKISRLGPRTKLSSAVSEFVKRLLQVSRTCPTLQYHSTLAALTRYWRDAGERSDLIGVIPAILLRTECTK